MAAAKPAPGNLDAVIGANVRKHRERLGASHDDLAQALRDRGWRASGPVLVALERGNRRVGFEEVLLLADVLHVPVTALLETPDLVRLGWLIPERDGHLIARLTSSHFHYTGDAPETWGLLERARRASQLSMSTHAGVAPRGHVVGDESLREAERHAAERLGIPPAEVVGRAYALWGQTLSEERDARAARRIDANTTKRQRAAVRAHVTRKLLDQLRAFEEAP
jgi:hypothetical protein